MFKGFELYPATNSFGVHMDCIGNSTGLYFYSAIFQGNMALLAFVGVFEVFRRQAFDNKIALLENNIIIGIQNVFRLRHTQPVLLEAKHAGDFRSALEGIASWRKDNPANVSFADTADDLLKADWLRDREFLLVALRKRRSKTMSEMLVPICAVSMVCLMSIILLTLSERIHHYCLCSEPFLFAFVILANITAVVLALRFAFRCLRSLSDA